MKKLLLITLGLVVAIALGLAIAVRILLSPDSVRSAVESQATAALGVPVTVGSAAVQIWPRPRLTLADVVVGKPAQLTLRSAQLSTGLRPLLSRRVEDGEVLIENSRLDLPQLLATLSALGSAGRSSSSNSSSTGASGSASQPGTGGSAPAITIVNVRAIGLRDVELVAGDRRAAVTFESSLSGDRLDISNLTARTDGTTLHATGAIESLARRVVRLSIDADVLDLDGLMQFAAALSGAPSASGTSGGATSTASRASGTGAMAVDFRADVRAKKGHAAGLAFSDLTTTIAVGPETVTLAPLKLHLLAGALDGKVVLTLAGAQPELALSGTVNGINLQELSAFVGQPSAITGTMNGRMAVTGRGLDPAVALQTASGTADVSLLKGRVPGLDLVRPAVLLFGRPTGAQAEGSGEAYERISATLAIDRGLIQTNDLVFDSRDVDVNGAGSFAIAGGALDLKADLLLSEELSAQAGRDLVRYTREGDRVVLPATIGGTVAAPRVMIDQQQAAKRAIRNEVQERAKSLFERFLPGSRPKKP